VRLRAPPRSSLFPSTTLFRSLVSVTVIVARFVWVFPATYLPRWLSARVRQRDPSPPWQLPALVSWAGLRGDGSRCRTRALNNRRSEEHTSELQSLAYLVCRLL